MDIDLLLPIYMAMIRHRRNVTTDDPIGRFYSSEIFDRNILPIIIGFLHDKMVVDRNEDCVVFKNCTVSFDDRHNPVIRCYDTKKSDELIASIIMARLRRQTSQLPYDMSDSVKFIRHKKRQGGIFLGYIDLDSSKDHSALYELLVDNINPNGCVLLKYNDNFIEVRYSPIPYLVEYFAIEGLVTLWYRGREIIKFVHNKAKQTKSVSHNGVECYYNVSVNNIEYYNNKLAKEKNNIRINNKLYTKCNSIDFVHIATALRKPMYLQMTYPFRSPILYASLITRLKIAGAKSVVDMICDAFDLSFPEIALGMNIRNRLTKCTTFTDVMKHVVKMGNENSIRFVFYSDVVDEERKQLIDTFRPYEAVHGMLDYVPRSHTGPVITKGCFISEFSTVSMPTYCVLVCKENESFIRNMVSSIERSNTDDIRLDFPLDMPDCIQDVIKENRPTKYNNAVKDSADNKEQPITPTTGASFINRIGLLIKACDWCGMCHSSSRCYSTELCPLCYTNHKPSLPVLEECTECNGYMYKDCLLHYKHSMYCKKKYVWCTLCNTSVNPNDIINRVHYHVPIRRQI